MWIELQSLEFNINNFQNQILEWIHSERWKWVRTDKNAPIVQNKVTFEIKKKEKKVTWQTSADPLGSVPLGHGVWPAAHVRSGWPEAFPSFFYWEESLLRSAAQHWSFPYWDSSGSCHRYLLQRENERNFIWIFICLFSHVSVSGVVVNWVTYWESRSSGHWECSDFGL